MSGGWYPVSGLEGVPHLRSGGVPHLRSGVPPRWISKASSCYAAGGMPLAFTQEDFLVQDIFSLNYYRDVHHNLNIYKKEVNVIRTFERFSNNFLRKILK